MRTVHIEASNQYDILIGAGLAEHAGQHVNEAINRGINPSNRRKCVIFTDTNVGPLHLQKISDSLSEYFEVNTFMLEAGEESKNMQSLTVLLEYMAEKRLTRGDFAVALGGGVVGDITGFAAAVYMRGIRFVQIPTSLLAAVDSSVGGKTAVDLDGGKNLAGAFHQPELVLLDTDLLATLPTAELANGMAEVIKYGVLKGGELYGKLTEVAERAEEKKAAGASVEGAEKYDSSEPCWAQILREETDTLSDIIEECVSIKRDYVAKDEFDRGDRMFLNLGHTYGHAVEKRSNFELAHGQSVAIGLAKIMRDCAEKGICSKEDCDSVVGLLAAYSLPTEVPYPMDELEKLLLVDKKVGDKGVTFILVRAIGDCYISN